MRGFVVVALAAAALIVALPGQAAPRASSLLLFSAGSRPDLYVVRPDGTHLRRLTSGLADAFGGVWSPDGSRIAFTGRPSGSTFTEIYSVRPNGSVLRRLTFNGLPDFNPVWSPDGSKLAFFECPATPVPCVRTDVIVVSANGANATRVAGGGPKRDLVWSPNGRELAFAGDPFQGDFAVHVVDLATGSERRLERGSSDPAWSPDGSRLAFVQHGDIANALVVTDLRQIGNQFLLRTPLSTFLFGPRWSPDGSRIVFSREANGARVLQVVRTAGGGARTLTRGPRRLDVFPTWSPNGKRIAFLRYRRQARRWAVAVVNANGSKLRLLRTPPVAVDAGGPEWQPAPR